MRLLLVSGNLTRKSSANLGFVMVLSCMALALPSIFGLPGSPRDLIIAAMALNVALIALARRLPWDRWNPRALLAWPVLVFIETAATSLVSPRGSVTAMTGLIVIAFLYIGMTQPSLTGIGCVPLAIPIWIICSGGWSHQLTLKAPTVLGIWIIVAETISWLRSQVHQLTSVLETQNLTDSLTGLASRRALDMRLATVTDGDSIIFIDLDHFKSVNDRDGHGAGDIVLSSLGATLRKVIRSSHDLAARFGGEEFLIVLTGGGLNGAITTLEQIKAEWSHVSPGVTFSAGVAVVGPAGNGASAIEAADRALYVAKQSGRDRWEVATLRSA